MRLQRLAQILFCSALIVLLVGYGGVVTKAKWIASVLLGLACLVQAVAPLKASDLPRWLKISFSLIGIYVIFTLIPFPAGLVRILSPGQDEILQGLSGVEKPSFIHLSMAPYATWGALGALLAGFAVFYLNFKWCSERFYQQAAFGIIFILGAIAAMAALLEPRYAGSAYTLSKSTQTFYGFFVNRNHLATFLNVASMIGVGLFFQLLSSQAHRKGIKIAGALVVLIVVVFCCVVSLRTASRSGVVSLFIGVLAFAVLSTINDPRHIRLKAFSVALVVLAIGLLTLGKSTFKRFESVLNPSSLVQTDSRWVTWIAAREMAGSLSYRGAGVGSFETVFPIFKRKVGHRTMTHVENEFLETWVEWGVVGSLILLGASLLFLKNTFFAPDKSRWDDLYVSAWSSLVVLLFHSAVDFPWHIPSIAFVLILLLSFILSKSHQAADGLRLTRNPLLGLVAIILFTLPLSEYHSAAHGIDRLEKAITSKQYTKAMTGSVLMTRTWPFYWRAYELAAYAVAGSGGPVSVQRQLFETAQNLSPSNPKISLYAGRMLYRHHPEIAVDLFEQACLSSETPLQTLEEALKVALTEKRNLHLLIPLITSRLDFWEKSVMMTFGYKEAGQEYREFTKELGLEGLRRWWGSVRERVTVSRMLNSMNSNEDLIRAQTKLTDPTAYELYWLANAYRDSGRFEDAARVGRKAYEIQAHPPPFQFEISLNDEMLLKASVEKTNIPLQMSVANTCVSMKKYAEAIPFFKQVLAIEPRKIEAIYGLGIATYETGDFKSSAALFYDLDCMLKLFNLPDSIQ